MMDRMYKEDEARPSGNTSSSNDGVFLYDVFLSFRGRDTRQGFTSFLHQALKQLPVRTFIDEKEFPKGERITKLLEYMESSRIVVPILSKNYAKSKWCLLEAAKMVESADGTQQKMRLIIPVFYKVDPSEVKDDGGLYQSAIVKLEKEGGLEGVNVQECKDALKTIGRISGFVFKKGTKENEADMVTDICKRVQEFVRTSVPFGDQPIGIDSQIGALITMLEAQADGVCTIGICGKGGIGKTTIAKAITDKVFSKFDGRSFIEDVGARAEREGLPAIQRKIISDVLNLKRESISIQTVGEGRNIIKRKLNSKRVLIVLDNIVKLDQLQKLLGDHICHKLNDLFGKGSKIIVTARDEGILLSYGIAKPQIHHPHELESTWSEKLFHQCAFKHGPPPCFNSKLQKLAQKVAEIAGGLPLVLVTVGSVFADLRKIEDWEDELEYLREDKGLDVLKMLRWSYDVLDDKQKCVFLDIACLLVGTKRKHATYLWDGRSPKRAIRVLQERNLISIDDEDRFRMHELIQEMGRWIGSGEGNLERNMNIRLCYKNGESKKLMDFQEKGKVEGIVLNMEEKCTKTNLTTIEQFSKGLKWLQWRGCILESVTFDNTSFENLVVLDLSRSNIHELKLNNKLDRLKVLDLSNSYIEATPDFAWTPKLEMLFLDDCIKLCEVHESICLLGNLTTLSMRNCESVEELPEMHGHSNANPSKLEELNLQGCRRLRSLPQLPSSLKTLVLQGCKILKAVHGFQNFESMELLDMDGCENINFTLMRSLFKGKTFSHLEELSASRSKAKSEDETFSFMVPRDSPNPLPLQRLQCYGDETFSFLVPLVSPRSPLLLEQLQCYGEGSKSGSLSNIDIKVSVKNMEDNPVIDEPIFSGYRDFDNEIDGQDDWCYTVYFSEYDQINRSPHLCRPCSICVSTVQNFPLIRVNILLRSAHRWSKNYSKSIRVSENVTNSRSISAEQNQPLPSMLSAEYFTFEFDVLLKEDTPNRYSAIQQRDICIVTTTGRGPTTDTGSLPHGCEDGESKRKELLNCIKKFIIPVYLQVHPSDIRDQKEKFEAYLSCHKNEDQEVVEDWKKALEVVVERCLHQFGHVEELITVICNRISSMLNSVTFTMTPTWFGVEDVMRMLKKDRNDVCMVGICGQSGTRKTTHVKARYDRLSHEFDGKEMEWQFDRQRALIVFDDKFESRQILYPDLSGKDIVRRGVKEANIYFAHELNNMQSLPLLGYYAFKGKQPTAEIVELARKVTEFAGGLPLGIAVLGSLLSSMGTKEEWESMLEKLTGAPGKGLEKVVNVSMDALNPNQLQVFFDIACLKECASSPWKDGGHYPGNTIKFLEERCLISLDAEDRPKMHDHIRHCGHKWGIRNGHCKCEMPAMKILDGLDLDHQNIFLDVACCLIGHENEYATYMWEDCGYCPTDAVEVLQDRSLISIDEKGRFRMDDKIRDEGRSMVEKREFTPCMYSRIWNENDLQKALDDWEAGWSNYHIKGINSILRMFDRMPIRIEAMGNLRVLHLTNYIVDDNSLQLLKNLRWLRMERCEVLSWEVIKDGGILEKLLVLQLHECKITRLDEQDVASSGNNHQEVFIFKKLKVLEIKCDGDVALASLNFSFMPSLVKLVIEVIKSSRNFDKIPKSIWELGKLEYLRIADGAFKKLSSSISNLSSLQTLDLKGSYYLSELPKDLRDLAALRELLLSNCYELKEIPSCVVELNQLKTLMVRDCTSLQLLPQLPSSLITLDASRCTKLRQVADISSLKDLRTLNLKGCDALQDVAGLQTLKLLTSLKLPYHISQRENFRSPSY